MSQVMTKFLEVLILVLVPSYIGVVLRVNKFFITFVKIPVSEVANMTLTGANGLKKPSILCLKQ